MLIQYAAAHLADYMTHLVHICNTILLPSKLMLANVIFRSGLLLQLIHKMMKLQLIHKMTKNWRRYLTTKVGETSDQIPCVVH